VGLKRIIILVIDRERARSKWGENIPVLNKIIDLQGDDSSNDDAVLIGMLSKDLKLRGSVLDNPKESGIPPSVRPLTALVSDRDTIIMEDHFGRVSLDGLIKSAINHLVTGVVIAVKGNLNEDGIFIVNDWIYSYELKPAIVANPRPIADTGNGKFVMFASGLLIGSTEANDVHDLAVQHLVEFVCGRFGNDTLTSMASRIARIVFAGNSVVPTDPMQIKEKFSSQKYKASLSTPSKQFDIWVAQLLSSCSVDVMPGASDPANTALPQQPFHPCLFPHSSRFGTLERVTNPYQYTLDQVSILGHSGQPVRDISRLTNGDMYTWPTPQHGSHQPPSFHASVPVTESQTTSSANDAEEEADTENTPVVVDSAVDLEETVEVDPKPKRLKVDFQSATRRLDILKKTLEWGHICPTAPDTIPSYPFADRDPYILTKENMPNILFSGNQPGYATELVEVHDDGQKAPHRVRIISVPEFRSTGTVVLCNISDPEFPCFPITFR
jgi:DNA polymerase II small subunit/DNA polymerase delta subunit B